MPFWQAPENRHLTVRLATLCGPHASDVRQAERVVCWFSWSPRRK